MCICLWPEFDCPEVTLCGWQDIKIQLLLLLLLFGSRHVLHWPCLRGTYPALEPAQHSTGSSVALQTLLAWEGNWLVVQVFFLPFFFFFWLVVLCTLSLIIMYINIKRSWTHALIKPELFKYHSVCCFSDGLNKSVVVVWGRNIIFLQIFFYLAMAPFQTPVHHPSLTAHLPAQDSLIACAHLVTMDTNVSDR